MRILGVDPSLTSTGLCIIADAERPILDITLATVTSKPSPDKSYRAMSARIAAIVETITGRFAGVDQLVIEGPSFGSKGQHTHSRDWLWGKIFDASVAAGIPVLIATPSQRMKYATGRGNAQKDQVLAAVIRRWPDADVTGNDTADALILAAIGARHLGRPIDATPQAHWATVMDKLAS